MKGKDKNKNKSCNQCEGKGYIEIRDCAGEIQRTETCSYCGGLGQTKAAIKDDAQLVLQDTTSHNS